MTDPDLLARYGRAWERYDKADRRRILRAVNRAQPLDDPAEAALAVVFAQRQRRLWRRWWFVIPTVGALFAFPLGLEAVVGNLVAGLALVGLLAVFFIWRANRALAANRAVVEEAVARKRARASKSKSRGGGRSGRKGKGRRGGRR